MPVKPGSITDNSTPVVMSDTSGAASALILLSGTYAGVNISVKGRSNNSPAGKWYPLAMQRLADGTVEATSGALTNTDRAWQVVSAGFDQIEVLPSAYVSGTGSIVIQTGDKPLLIPAGSTAIVGTLADSIADGADVAQGTTTDAPSTAVEDGTARTAISLLKGIKNYLRTMSTSVVLAAGSALVGKFGIDQTTPGSTNAVVGSIEGGTLYNGATALTPKFAAIAAATSGGNTLVAAVTSKKIRVLSLALIAGAAGNIYFNSGASGTVIFGGSTNKIQLPANGGLVLPFNPLGWFETAAGALLELQASSTGPFSGGLVYVEV